ncbi:MAG: response regulator [Rubritepida sp.]|nr:response regulator [Rubritepida sp.]
MNPLRILLAEDEPLIAMLMARVLRVLGHEVCAVEATEAGAVAAAALYRPQLMIVDAGLRRGSGVAAVQAILRQGFIPHVFVSGAVIAGLGPEAVVLLKPYTEAELVAAMQRAMAAPLSA